MIREVMLHLFQVCDITNVPSECDYTIANEVILHIFQVSDSTDVPSKC